MRRLLSLLTATLLLAGCAQDESPEAPVDDTEAPEQNVTAAPEPLSFSGSLVAVAEPAMGTTTGCDTGENGCETHPFTTEETWRVTLTLASNDGIVTGTTAQVLWGSDYDLFLTDGSGREIASSTNPGAEDDVIEATLEPGTYEVRVMAWNDVDGTYDLTIEFAAVAPPPASGDATSEA